MSVPVKSSSVNARANIVVEDLIAGGFTRGSVAAKAIDAFCGRNRRPLNAGKSLTDREYLRVLPAALRKLAEKVQQASGIFVG